MAGDWIKIEHALPNKPEVMSIADELGISDAAVVGHLVRFWIWVDQNLSEDCKKVLATSKGIDRVAEISGFTDAMIKVGWLSLESDGITIPNYEAHLSHSSKKRASTSRRVAKHRNADVTEMKRNPVTKETLSRITRRRILERDNKMCLYCGRREGEYKPGIETKVDALLSIDHVIPESKGGDGSDSNLVTCCMACNREKSNRSPDECGFPWPTDVTGKRYGSVTESLPEKRREEKIKEEDPPLPPKGEEGRKKVPLLAIEDLTFPPSLDNLQGRSAISEWLAYKRTLGKGYKSAAFVEKLLIEFANETPEKLQEAVDFSIARNYQGLIRPQGKSNGQTQSREQRQIASLERAIAKAEQQERDAQGADAARQGLRGLPGG